MAKRTGHLVFIDADLWKRFTLIVPSEMTTSDAITLMIKAKLKEAEDARDNSAKGAEGV